MIKVKAKDFVELINRTAYALGKRHPKYTLQGFCLEAYEGGLSLAATDRMRVAIARCEADCHESFSAIVDPGILCEELKRADGVLTIVNQPRQVDFLHKTFAGATDKLAGVFPDIASCIKLPLASGKAVVGDFKEFVEHCQILDGIVVLPIGGLRIQVTRQHLLDALYCLPIDGELQMDIVDEHSPLVFRAEDFLYILMPCA